MSGRLKIVKFVFMLLIALICIDGLLLFHSTHVLSPATHNASAPSGSSHTLSSSAPDLTTSRLAMPTGDIAGWHQVFADDFTDATLNTTNWGAYEGQPGGDAAGWWAPSHVVVNDGMLTLKGYRDPAAKAGVFVTGGIGMRGSHAQTYGKYLVRMRVDKGANVSAIALLWPEADAWPPEIDFNEGWDSNRTQTNAWFHCGSNGNDTCRIHSSLTGYDFSQWHTFGVEWTVGGLAYTIDNITWATVTDSRTPSIPMVLDLQTQALKLGSSIPSEVDMQVDWVVVYTSAH
jgi:beta-glucanase (GH16 family)